MLMPFFMNHPNCKLCLTNPADKRNSHIIPKFLCKGLYEASAPRHALLVNRNGKRQKVQDIPKEHNILCSLCEKKIEVVETLFSQVVEDIHNYSDLREKFVIFRIGKQDYLECLELNPTLYKLFLYSLVWRASISNLYAYAPFNLSKTSEETIRSFLNSNLSLTKHGLLNNLQSITSIPLFHNCIIKPKEKSPNSRGIFSIASMSETAHAMFLVDFAIFFYTDEVSIGRVLEKFSNKQNEKVLIALGDTQPWRDLNQLYLTKMLNNQNSSSP
jgi:hypothetical protein